LNGPTIIEDAFALANGKPFVIDTPERSNALVTSSHHIQELNRAPRSMLSLQAVAKQVRYAAPFNIAVLTRLKVLAA
jgi:hypothetical protein